MLFYTLLGAVVGAVVGHLLPPGYIFWFLIGALSGYVAQRFVGRRY